ncbi:MAG TPA: AraC family transcriptional regulator [Phycisphaerae bacterium]|mgnify:CR=1 FL=1|nr:AraC family transcriptional regulator [Phycisphaerae bacterium]
MSKLVSRPGARPVLRSASRMSLPPQWHMPSHAHDDHYEMLVILSGQNEVYIRGRRFVARVGDVLVYPPGVAHAENSAGESLGMLFVTFRADPARWSDLPGHRPDSHGRVKLLVQWMLELLPVHSAREQATLDALLQAALHEHGTPSQADEYGLVPQVRQYVSNRIAEPIRLDDLAAATHLSRFHFARRFRAATGVPPMTFVRRMRVETAVQLLVNSRLPLKVIAEMVGLNDQFQLSKTVRRLTGRPPGALRAARR